MLDKSIFVLNIYSKIIFPGGAAPDPPISSLREPRRATRARQDADDTVKSLQEDDKYIDLHMKCDCPHTHRGCGASAPHPLCVCAPSHTFIHISMYFSSLYKLFSLKSAPCGAREAMKWGVWGSPPGNMILE